MSDSYLVIGKDGILGRAVMAQLGPRAIGLGHGECELADVSFMDAVEAAYLARPFAGLINCAAYTQVDDAENEDSGTLLRVNAVAPGELAAWCAKRQIPLVHFSTDYVFDGSGHAPRKESDTPAPLNAYGMSKLAGERAVEAAQGDYLIFRTSWVYAETGRNFFTTISQLMAERPALRVVHDQIGAPTYAGHLAAATIVALETARRQGVFPKGIYHLCSGGETSWCGFAQAIWAQKAAREPGLMCQQVVAVPSSEFPKPAPRPLNSRLDCHKAREVLHVTMPSWQEGLDACFGAATLV